MITLKTWMELVGYQITETDDLYVYGKDTQSFTCYVTDKYGVEIVFDRKTQEVFEVSVVDYLNNRPYRLIAEPHREDQIKNNIAWDDVKWIDLETDDDFVDKAQAIIAGLDYDSRISIPLDIDNDVLLQLALLAHKQDITLNQLFAQIIQEAIDGHEDN